MNRLPRMGARHSGGDHAALKRFCQYCSKRPLRRFARRARMALAPRRVQNVPDGLSRDPMMVLHPASITPEEAMKRCCFAKDGAAHATGVVRKVFRFDVHPLAALVGRIQCVIERESPARVSSISVSPGQEAGGARLSNLRTALKSGRIPGCHAPSSVWRSQSQSRDSTISLPSGSRTACRGVRPPRAGIFW